MFDRFRIVEAYYHFLSQTYCGQGDKKYERLCKLLGYYKPSLVGTVSDETLSDVLWLVEHEKGNGL